MQREPTGTEIVAAILHTAYFVLLLVKRICIPERKIWKFILETTKMLLCFSSMRRCAALFSPRLTKPSRHGQVRASVPQSGSKANGCSRPSARVPTSRRRALLLGAVGRIARLQIGEFYVPQTGNEPQAVSLQPSCYSSRSLSPLTMALLVASRRSSYGDCEDTLLLPARRIPRATGCNPSILLLWIDSLGCNFLAVLDGELCSSFGITSTVGLNTCVTSQAAAHALGGLSGKGSLSAVRSWRTR